MNGVFTRRITSLIFLSVMVLLCHGVSAQNKKPKTWAEKLGYPKGKKIIMLHADDLGMCDEANKAGIMQLSTGVIQSAAVMMPCPYAADMIEWAKQNPEQDIGLHLTLTSEWKTYRWGSVDDDVPTLLDTDQKLWRKETDVAKNGTVTDVEKEIRAQIEKSIAMGYRPDHIDTHMGTLYTRTDFTRAFFKVAEEYNIPANAIELSPRVLKFVKKQGIPVTDEAIQLFNDYKLPKLDFFASVPKGKTYKQKVRRFKLLVWYVKPGLTEIIFHPSVQTDNLKTITGSWQQRVWEAEMFSDPKLIKYFKRKGIIFTNWLEIMERHNKLVATGNE